MIESGRMISHYKLVDQIGVGGMGVVWKAEDAILQRPVAIKFLRPDAARSSSRREMFLTEARLVPRSPTHTLFRCTSWAATPTSTSS